MGKTSLLGAVLATLILMLAACGKAADNSADASPQSTASAPASASASAAASTSAAASSASASPAQAVTIKHDFGETVVPAHPQRIVSYDMEDMLLSLNVPLVQAFSAEGFYLDSQLKEKGISINTSMDLNMEVFASANPDLIIINKNMLDQSSYEQISKIAPTLPLARDDWQQSLPELGKALGMETEAQTIIDDYKAKLEQAKAAIVDKVGADKTVAFIRPSTKDVELDFPAWIWTAVLYRDLGLKPDPKVLDIEKNSSDTWGGSMISLETLPDLTADYLFMDYGSSLSKEADFQKEVAVSAEVEKLNIWQAIPAVKQGNVFKVSARHWALNGPMADSLKIDDVVQALTSK
ncbi:ABC transporter substrate-binding protein [Cohnella sp. GCM10020058]|uniref:ABC transporter substrate-binding protein n=1 Tax=Cohnella sp. GCM10020058 TaxID=3317330 RepID=UPI0036406C83